MGMMLMMTTGITTMMMMMIRVTVEEVRVLEPLIIFSLAYLSYITAGMFSWSPIISLIGCGLVQVLDNHQHHCQHHHHNTLLMIIQPGPLRLQKHQLKVSAHCEGNHPASQLNKVSLI